MRNSRLQQVDETEQAESFNLITPPGPAPVPGPARDQAVLESRLSGLIVTALKALSQRSLVAISSLFTLLLAASAFFLWTTVLAAPTVIQLVGVGMYAVFVLVLEFVRRR